MKAIEMESKVDFFIEERNILEVTKLNQQAFMEPILSINHKMVSSETALRVVKNSKTAKYPEEYSKMAWDRLVTMYALKTTLSILKLMK